MLWSNLVGPYNESTMGYHDGGKSDFSWIDYKKRNWTVPANVSYMESHDEERLMYKNVQFGNSNGPYNIKDLSTALEREQIAGAFFFTVPGPRMIWQFGELGYDFSINRCPNGSISNDCRVSNKPIRWDYYDDPERKAIYDVWAKLIKLRLQEDIFKTGNFTLDVASTTGLKKIQLSDDGAGSSLTYVNIIGNFGVSTQSIDPEFQETGIWYDLLDDNNELNVSNVNQLISLQPGEFRVYGSSQVAIPVQEYDPLGELNIYLFIKSFLCPNVQHSQDVFISFIC